MKKKKTIYYLDDDHEDLDFFKEITEELGHTVKVFSDGRKMLLVLEIQAQKPDVVFLDIHMPVLNGEEILEIIKKSDDMKDIPVVMVSGAYPKKLLQYCADLGVSCLVKRHNFQEFKQNIHEVLTTLDAAKKAG
ncbi:response regulator [Flavobacterium wongokense]|uniref:response regulator n=1 Tax=Flavobacterium wongokense TaxID=2910674 RepID=UPI001F2FD321|nr:response regulator [Flavobacterium sp. WG47]MCF6133177.1 response regulator [Flavobacterium sp. WG47]